jgi:hypothetical protein
VLLLTPALGLCSQINFATIKDSPYIVQFSIIPVP